MMDIATMCKGQCDGRGTYPEYVGPMNEDGTQPVEGSGDWDADWIFVVCPDCNGSGFSSDPPNQIDILASYLLQEFPDEIREGQGAGEVAVRLLTQYKER